MNKAKLKLKEYISTANASIPVKRPPGVDPPRAPSPDVFSGTSEYTDFTDESDPNDPDFQLDSEPERNRPLSQIEADYYVAKCGMSIRLSEFAISFLKARGLTQSNVNATAYRKRQSEFQEFYTANENNTYAYCHNIPDLVNAMRVNYSPGDWRLFIDGSTSSLKVVLLHKTNDKPSIPLAFSTDMHEDYETMKKILHDIKYEENAWKICCDLKVVNILQGIITKGGFPKYFCFLCNWDSRYKQDQYAATHWVPRDAYNQQKLGLRNEPSIKNVGDILLPPLHIKLGIAKKFIEVVVRDVAGAFESLEKIFPKLSPAKIKAGIVSHLNNFNLMCVFVHLNFAFLLISSKYLF